MRSPFSLRKGINVPEFSYLRKLSVETPSWKAAWEMERGKEVLTFFRNKYRLLSESEIIKVALAEKYSKEAEIPMVDEETEEMIARSWKDYNNGRYTEVKTEEELENYLKSL